MSWATQGQMTKQEKEKMFSFWEEHAPENPINHPDAWHGSLVAVDGGYMAPIEDYNELGGIEVLGYASLTYPEGKYSESK